MSLTFPVNTVFTLTWTLTQADGTPINNASMVATLYSGRSATNPSATPGTPIGPINALPLVYVSGSAGQYSALVPATLNPPSDGIGFTLVLDATVAGIQIYHAEEACAIETSGPTVDLVTLDQVKNWIPGLNQTNIPSSTTDDALMQSCITAWSYEFLRRTGLGDQSGDYTQSPFNAVCAWDEFYDGAGTNRLFLRNRPVVSITSLTVNGIPLTASTGFAVQGYVLDGTRKSISLRTGILGFGTQLWTSWQAGPYHAFGGGGKFPRGVQNIEVQYNAGYKSTPADIIECAVKVVHQNYKRRPYSDEESRAMAGGGGNIRYRSWDIPPECQATVDRYTRTL